MTATTTKTTTTQAAPTLRGMVSYFARLGTTGFGGPVALAGAMQRDLVDERRWVTAEEYKEALAFTQLAPGPLAAQLAMALGWTRFGVAGATLAGLAFVLPSFAMVVALAVAYVRFGGLPWMQGTSCPRAAIDCRPKRSGSMPAVLAAAKSATATSTTSAGTAATLATRSTMLA